MTKTEVRILVLTIITLCLVCVHFIGVSQRAHAQGYDAGIAFGTGDPGAAAEARTAESVADAPIEAAGELASAVRDGDWRKTVALVLSLLMLLLSKVRARISFLSGDRAGVALLFVLSASGGLVTSLFGAAPIDLKMFIAAFEIGLYAMGGFLGVKKMLWPSDEKDE